MSTRAVCKPSSVPTDAEASSGDGHPSAAAGRPTAHAADPRAGQRASPPARFPGTGCALLFGLAPGGVCPFHSGIDPRAEDRHRHCGTGPRLATDGCYPPPCAAELGLSSRRQRVTPIVPRDHPTVSLTSRFYDDRPRRSARHRARRLTAPDRASPDRTGRRRRPSCRRAARRHVRPALPGSSRRRGHTSCARAGRARGR